MKSLVRRATASRQLIAQILDRPELVAAVQALPAAALGKLIERVGLEDAGDLVALASSEQLQQLFDDDLWRAEAPGADEQFRPERFALWLEIIAEGGERFLVEQLCALPRDLLALAVHRLVLVVDMDALFERLDALSEEAQRLERALELPLFEEWQEFRLLARDPAHWDVVWPALVALDRDHHELLRAIVEQCCALGREQAEEQGGLYEVLTSAQMLEGDVAGEREDRRAAAGFVAPSDARAFLELARRGERLAARDAISTAYFRTLSRAQPAPRAAGAARAAVAPRAGARAEPVADLRRLVRLLEEAAVIEPATPSPLAALAAGEAEAGARGEPLSLLQAALLELRGEDEALFGERLEELGYLANVLIAGSSGRRPRPVEALEKAMAVCSAGLERALGDDRALARAVALLRRTSADVLFRRGYDR